MRKRELTVTERAAFIGWRLMAGDVWTTAEVAALMGMEHSAAYKRLCDISRVLPIYQDENNCWRRVDENEASEIFDTLFKLLVFSMKLRR